MSQILPALFQQHSVQIFHGFHGFRFGNRNADIAADIAHQTFYPPLFVAGCRIAEYRFKTVVSGQSGITRLLPGTGTEAILTRYFRTPQRLILASLILNIVCALCQMKNFWHYDIIRSTREQMFYIIVT